MWEESPRTQGDGLKPKAPLGKPVLQPEVVRRTVDACFPGSLGNLPVAPRVLGESSQGGIRGGIPFSWP